MENNLPILFKDFISEVTAEGRREQGIRSLKQRIPKLFQYLNKNNISLFSFGRKEAIGYQGWLIETGRNDGTPYSFRTILTYLTAASCFFDYLKGKSLILTNPFKEMKYLKAEKTLPKSILKESEMNKLLSFFETYSDRKNLKLKIRSYRIHVLLELLYSTGLRITESASLKIDDIDFAASVIRLREGKGGFPRTVILNSYMAEILEIYVAEIRNLIIGKRHDKELLFGTPWEPFGKWANLALKEASEQLSIPNIRCHGVRHAVGYHLLRAGCPMRSIQTILGHRRIKNTEIYTKVDKEDLRNVIDTYHPR